MAVSKLKTAQITALDTYQPGGDVLSAGLGAPARTTTVSGSVTAVAADSVLTTYQMVRVPSAAVIKYVGLSSQAQGAGAVQVGVYYSSSKIDGTAVANQGLVVPTTGLRFFMNDQSLATALVQTDLTFGDAANAGSYDQSMINKRLWDALGLATDPGGFFDIVLTVHTTAVTTGTGKISLQVEYAE